MLPRPLLAPALAAFLAVAAGAPAAADSLHPAAPAPPTAPASAKEPEKPVAASAPAPVTPPASDDQPDAVPEVTAYDSPAAALAGILKRAEADSGTAPRVVAFGEYHELKGNTGVKSGLKRFGEELLAVLQPLTADLVLETWVTAGNCGKEEKNVVQDVQKTTKRPVTTENELVTLIKQARATGVQPHILEITCSEYQALLGSDGAVDYEKMLKLLSDLLAKKIAQVKLRREAAGIRKIVAVYGGALHNDLYPAADYRPYTFGPGTAIAFPGQYLEVDLYVPEFIAKDEALAKEPWFTAYTKASRPAAGAKNAPLKTWVVRRGKGSFILLFPRTRK